MRERREPALTNFRNRGLTTDPQEIRPKQSTILQPQPEFLGPRALHLTISANLRGVASGLSRPSPANRDSQMADRAAPKNSACDRKTLDRFR